jgi:hypothetical protein
MQFIKLCSTIGVVGCGLLLSTPAAAAVPCLTVVSEVLDDPSVGWLNAIGTRVTARSSFGFSSFSMSDGYQVETNPLHTAPAASRSIFDVPKLTALRAFNGEFNEVFPGRGNGDEDGWSFWVGSDGKFWLRSTTWGGSWTPLTSAVCYRGPGEQFVVTAQASAPGWGTDFWTFLLAPDGLI